MRRSVPARVRRGFTLPEVALATVIIGMGVVGVMQLTVTCTQTNAAANHQTVALFLANNIQEMLADLPFDDPAGTGFGTEELDVSQFDDIDDFNGLDTTGAAPLDSSRNAISGMDQYAQAVTVTQVNPMNLSSTQSGSEVRRVTVRILFRERPGMPQTVVYQTSWLRTRV